MLSLSFCLETMPRSNVSLPTRQGTDRYVQGVVLMTDGFLDRFKSRLPTLSGNHMG